MDVDSESPADLEYDHIPPLPTYRREVVEPNVRPSTAQEFAGLFPSFHRLSIRHDEFTPDGNMNLRVDTIVNSSRRRTSVQLFHLRMYDLARREFSLRRYCRDSGREVCNSKRKYAETPAKKPAKTSAGKRPGTGYSSGDGDDEFFNGSPSSLSIVDDDDNNNNNNGNGAAAKRSRALPTNTIKLEFSNYARVDVRRRGGKNNKRYEFEWWGHRYGWKRAVEKRLGLVSFHLVRDGNSADPVAHIVPEMRSPSQVLADENAGGWVPPCFMWIEDEKVLDAVTDVAE
jgi:hypothetical protein